MNHLRDAVLEFLHALREERPFLTPELIPRLKTDEFVHRVYDVAKDRQLAEGGSVMQDVWDMVIQDHYRYRTDEAFLTICQGKIAAHLLYAFILYLAPDHPEFQRIEMRTGYYRTHIWYFPASIAIMARLGYRLTPDGTAFNRGDGVNGHDIVDAIVRILVLEQELELVLWAVRRAVDERIRVPLHVILAEMRRRHYFLGTFWHAIRHHPSVRPITTGRTTANEDVIPIPASITTTTSHDIAITTGTGTTAASVAVTSHMPTPSYTSAPAPPIPVAFTTATSLHPSTRTPPITTAREAATPSHRTTPPITTAREAATPSHMPNWWMCRNCATVNSSAESTCRECDVESFLITVSPVGLGVDRSRQIELEGPVVPRAHSGREECPKCMFPISPGEDCPMCRNYTYGSTTANTTLFNPGTWF